MLGAKPRSSASALNCHLFIPHGALWMVDKLHMAMFLPVVAVKWLGWDGHCLVLLSLPLCLLQGPILCQHRPCQATECLRAQHDLLCRCLGRLQGLGSLGSGTWIKLGSFARVICALLNQLVYVCVCLHEFTRCMCKYVPTVPLEMKLQMVVCLHR